MKHLSILVPDDQTNMSTIACIIGTYQVFSEANNYLTKKGEEAIFKIELVGATKSNFLNNDLLSIKHQFAINEIDKTNLIIIPASLIRSYKTATSNNKLLINWLKNQYEQGAEIASMCAGSFMLASSGILDGKTCSTHWALSENFRELFPNVNLQTDKLITDEKGIYTNGGAYSFLHLLMYLVEKFYNRQTAIHCAKYFQIDLDRHFQSEFSIFSGHKKHNDEEILMAQKFIEENYQDKISIEKLSSDLNIGRRNFDRRFIKATNLTPLDYLQRVKIESAKKMFETTRKTVSEIMNEVGYNDAKAFRIVFNRVTGLSPSEYKVKYKIESR
ncbi:MAG: helix-turn-helix domain-containing protein [Bacteroidia bacterium]|nr:helix-turn-helix domain-containing protein [Bacteroidia bacterium]MCF8426491.1 helix-turn-helix domain-containing protein [Bacteroidia bacterium]